MHYAPTSKPGCLALAALAVVIAGCGRAPTPPPAAPASSAQTAAERQAALAEREAALTKRENELALKEREQALAQREAEMAAKETAAKREAAAAEARAKVKAERAKRTAAKSRSVHVAPSGTETGAPAASPVTATPPQAPLIVPAGTKLTATLTAALSTKTARVGDPVEARLVDDVIVDGRRAIAAGALVHGRVTHVISGSHKIGGTPVLGVRFDALEVRPGRAVTINSSLTQEGKSETAKDTAKILGGALAGVILGKQIGDRKGQLIGGVLGGAAGAVVAEKTGSEVELPQGTSVTLVLDAPLNVGDD